MAPSSSRATNSVVHGESTMSPSACSVNGRAEVDNSGNKALNPETSFCVTSLTISIVGFIGEFNLRGMQTTSTNDAQRDMHALSAPPYAAFSVSPIADSTVGAMSLCMGLTGSM